VKRKRVEKGIKDPGEGGKSKGVKSFGEDAVTGRDRKEKKHQKKRGGGYTREQIKELNC